MQTKRKLLLMCLIFSAVLIMAGCPGNSESETTSATNTDLNQTVAENTTAIAEPEPVPIVAGDEMPALLVPPTMPPQYEASDWEARDQIRIDNQVDVEFIEELNRFAYQTSAEILADAKANRNFSPISLYYALAITATGAEGRTYDEMSALLGLQDKELLSVLGGNLFRVMYTDNDITQLKMANSVWLRKGFEVKDAFVGNAVSQFYAWVYSADFTNPQTAVAVSKWIAENTNDTIEPEISLDRDTLMLIINTVYFYDEWQEAFNKEATVKDSFFKADGGEISADFMDKIFGAKSYYQGNGFTRIDLDLKGGGIMSFVLPDKDVAVSSFLANGTKLQEALEGGARDDAKIHLLLPKFKYGSDFNLVESLQKLGVVTAFGDQADFSALSPEAGLYISDIIQQSHIGVDENGVEAAAYTMVMISKMSAMIELEKTLELKFDRPFIFSIKSEDNVVLFVGVCDEPLSAN